MIRTHEPESTEDLRKIVEISVNTATAGGCPLLRSLFVRCRFALLNAASMERVPVAH